MVIVDTSVWIDWFGDRPNPQSDWLDGAMGRERLGLTDLILFELLQGCRDEQQAARVETRMTEFPVFSAAGIAVARDAARCYRSLRRAGRTVASAADCLTASFCLRCEYRLLHHDRDFDAFEDHFGLAVVHPDTRRG